MLSSTGAVIAHEYGALAHRHSERLPSRRKDGTGRERSDCNIQFCYLNMATGVCVASLVLILVGVVLSAISDLMLATIFFNIANELKEAELSRSEMK